MRKIALRADTYGAWQVLAAGLTEEEAAGLPRGGVTLPMIPVSGGDYFGGDNSCCLGAYTPDLVELGRFQLKEGLWPQARDVVVLEYARLASLGAEGGQIAALMGWEFLYLALAEARGWDRGCWPGAARISISAGAM